MVGWSLEKFGLSTTSMPLLIALPYAVAVPIGSSSDAISSQPTAQSTPLNSTRPVSPMILQSPRQLNAPEVCDTYRRRCQRSQEAVHNSTERQVSPHACPPTRQKRIRIPPHTELQRQRISDNNPARRISRDTVCRRSSYRTRRNPFWRSMHQHIHMRRHMQVTQL